MLQPLIRAFAAAALVPTVAAAQAPSIVIRGALVGASRGHAWVRAEGTAGRDSVRADSAGRFVLRVPRGPTVRVEAAGFFAARLATAAAADTGLAVVLVPGLWQVAAGSFAGVTSPISVDALVERVCAGCSGFLNRAGARAPFAPFRWPAPSFPLRVAFDRGWSSERVSARDSAAFWREAKQLEADLGLDLFSPATLREIGDDPARAILVYADHRLGRISGLGSVGADAAGSIVTANLAVRSFRLIHEPGAPGLAAHELMHTLGFGHTCAWRSVLADHGRCGALRSATATAEDAAYVQMVLAVHAAAGEVGARHPWVPTLEALAGGLPATVAALPRD